MKALILNNKVVEIAETEFQVNGIMQWVDCDDSVQIEYEYIDDIFVPYPPPLPRTYEQLRRCAYLLEGLNSENYLDAMRKARAGDSSDLDAMDLLADQIKAQYPEPE